MIIARYKFDSNINTNPLPPIISCSYTVSDVDNGDGTITRTLEGDALPAYLSFDNSGGVNTRSQSYLEIEVDISNLIDATMLFNGSSNLTSITFTGTNNIIKSMRSMFNGCSILTEVNLDCFDTSNVTDISGMFGSCKSIKTLDLSKLNTGQVTTMVSMFNGCKSLTNIIGIENFDTSNVTNMNYMFTDCSALTEINLNNWNTSKVTTMVNMFRACAALTELDLSNWDVSNVTNMDGVFNGYTTSMGLTKLNLHNWKPSKCTYIYQTFRGCSNLKYLDISNFVIRPDATFAGVFEVFGIENLGMLHCDKYTVNKVIEHLCGDSTIYVQDTKAYEYEDTNNDAVIQIRDYKEQEISLDLPQPLRSVGNYADRLYWDETKGRYCIEQKIGKGNFKDVIRTEFMSSVSGWTNDNYYTYNLHFPYEVKSQTAQYELCGFAENFMTSNEVNAYSNLIDYEFFIIRTGAATIKLSVSRGLNPDNSDNLGYLNEVCLNYIKTLDVDFYWVMNESIIIETDITEKLHFDTYEDYMKVEIEDKILPSNMSTAVSMKEKLKLPIVTLRPSSFNGTTWINEATGEPFDIKGTLRYNESENCIEQSSNGALQMANPLKYVSDYTVSFKYTAVSVKWDNSIISTHGGKGDGISIISYTKTNRMALYNAGESGDGQKDVAIPTFVNPTTYYYTLVFSTGQVKLYLDGQYYSTITMNVNASTSDKLTIGSRHNNSGDSNSILNYFTGKIHFLEIHDMHLTDDEIYESYLKNN